MAVPGGGIAHLGDQKTLGDESKPSWESAEEAEARRLPEGVLQTVLLL